jgi:hypothetical protein
VLHPKDSKCAITALNQALRPSTICIDLGPKSTLQEMSFPQTFSIPQKHFELSTLFNSKSLDAFR